MTAELILVPYPRSVQQKESSFQPSETLAISIADASVLFEAQHLLKILRPYHPKVEIVLGHVGSHTINFVLQPEIKAQGYVLDISSDGIHITYSDQAGLFYGVITLCQIIEQVGTNLPCLTIEDHPDFEQRGFMLDISRDRVPTMETLYQLIDELAQVKLNQFQLYIEHTFAYQEHKQVWELASPITSEELLLLDAYCRERHINFVPNQNSLGHMERWLIHEPYRDLSETPDGFEVFGEWRTPSTLDPQDPRSLDLIKDLYAEFLPHFSSDLFNVGCDEPWELGQGKSKEAVAERGGRVYLDWLLELHKLVTENQRKMMFWGDIIIKYPDLISELPNDIIVMEWGYEAIHPFEQNCQKYADANIPFYVCPGTSSWNTLVGRADNATGNLKNAAKYGLQQGAIGYLITDWGDNGHWQPMVASYIGILYGAAVSWCYESNHELNIADALSQHIYHDATQTIGNLTLQIANIYKHIKPAHINGQVLAYALQWKANELEAKLESVEGWGGEKTNISSTNLHDVIAQLHDLRGQLTHTRIQRDDVTLILAEWRQAIDLLIHGAEWLLLIQNAGDVSAEEQKRKLQRLMMTQRDLWLKRNRRGGLEDSMHRFQNLIDEYGAIAYEVSVQE